MASTPSLSPSLRMLSDSNPPRSARLMAARRIRSLDKAARRFAARLACVAIYLCLTADSIHRKWMQAYAVCGKLSRQAYGVSASPAGQEGSGTNDLDGDSRNYDKNNHDEGRRSGYVRHVRGPRTPGRRQARDRGARG